MQKYLRGCSGGLEDTAEKCSGEACEEKRRHRRPTQALARATWLKPPTSSIPLSTFPRNPNPRFLSIYAAIRVTLSLASPPHQLRAGATPASCSPNTFGVSVR